MNNGMWANPFSMYAPFMPFSPYPTAPQGKNEGKHKKEGANPADGFYPSAGNEKEEKNSGFKNFLIGMKDGIVDTVKGIFTLKGAAITLGTVFAAWATGGAILIPLAIGGMGVGGYQIIKGIANHDANKSGRGVDTFLLSLLGLKCAPSEFGGHALKADSVGGLWSKLKAPFRFENQFDPNRGVDFWRAGWDSTKEVFQNLGKNVGGKTREAAPSPGNVTPAETVEESLAPDPVTAETETLESTQTSQASSAPRSRVATPRTTTPRGSAATSQTSSTDSRTSRSKTSSTTNSSRRNTSTSSPGSETSNSTSSSGRTLTPENLEEFNRRLRESSRYRRRYAETPTPEPSSPASGTMSPQESEYSDYQDPGSPPSGPQQRTNPSFSRTTWEYIKAKKGGHTQNALNGLYMGGVLSSPTVKAKEAQDETETEAPMPGFPPFPYAPGFPPFP